MTIVGLNFTKMHAEKKDMYSGKVNISNNVNIKNIDSADLSLGTLKQGGLRIDFLFETKYEPNVGEIILEGNVLYMIESKKATDIITAWKKDKAVPKDIMANVINAVLQRCNIEALIMSKEINLPPPIPLPKVQETPVGPVNVIQPAEKKDKVEKKK